MLEFVEPARDLIADPTVQSILTPLTQAFFLGLMAWRSLGVAYAALTRAIATMTPAPAPVDPLTQSLLNRLDEECDLRVVFVENKPSHTQVVTPTAEFRPTFTFNDRTQKYDRRSCTAVVNGQDLFDLIPNDREKLLVAKKVHTIHDRLVAEAAQRRRLEFAAKVAGEEGQGEEGKKKDVPILGSMPGVGQTWNGPIPRGKKAQA